jgi:hypothetical protein
MAQRLKPVVLVGIAVATIAIVGALFTVGIFGDVDTDVSLRDREGGCRVTGKETEVSVKAGKKISWKIRNRCGAGTRVMVTVGNFRTREASTAADCTSATATGVTWPFENSEALAERQSETRISLELKDADELPERPTEYYFDICYGPNSGVVATDPRLVIEY